MLKPSLAVLLSAGIACSSYADELHVPSQFATIQAAIDAAVDGDEIVIAEGTYRELLDGQNKSLTYTGAGMGLTVLSGDLDDDGEADGMAMTLNSSPVPEFASVSMADLSIRDSTVGFACSGVTNSSFTRCEISGATQVGLDLNLVAGSVLIEQCEFHGCDYSLIADGGTNTVGLVVVDGVFRDSTRAASLYNIPAIISETEISKHSGQAILASECDLSMRNCSVLNNANGLTIQSCNLTVEDCLFESNRTTGIAAAIHADFATSSNSTLVERTTFRDNGGGGFGGAVTTTGNTTYRDCLFEANMAEYGSAIHATGTNVLIEGCEFTGNLGEWSGALNSAGDCRVVGCRFVGNGRETGTKFGIPNGGGAICVEDRSLFVDDCEFIDNRAFLAGAIFEMRGSCAIRNSRFYANKAVGIRSRAGAIAIHSSSPVSNCVFVGNEALDGRSGAYHGVTGDRTDRIPPRIDACVFFQNKAGLGNIASSNREDSFQVANSLIVVESMFNNFYNDGSADISDAPIHASNLMTTRPQDIGFVRLPDDGGDGWGDDHSTPDIDEGANDDYGDLRLLAHSPAIDAGENLEIPADWSDADNDGDSDEPVTDYFDMDGNPRFVDTAGMPDVYPGNDYGGPIDLGPYEFQGTSCLADVNYDGSLTPTDFTAWIDAFNNNQPPADQNRDGDINAADFTAWIANFNAGC